MDALMKLSAAERLRVAAALVDDVAAGRTDRVLGLVRVIDIVSLVIRSLASELARGCTNG